MSVHNSILFSTLVYFLSFVDISSTECVPVLMWGNIRHSKSVSPLKKINQELFADIVENQLNRKSLLVVFAEQTLSPEDFNSEDENGKSIFSTLASLKESTTVNYLPCIKSPISSVTNLKERRVIETSVSTVLSDIVKVREGDILLIDMNDASEDEDRVNMLHRHDRNMEEIYAHLSKVHKDLVMIYTAYQPSRVISEDVRSHRHIRDVSKANETVEPEKIYIVRKTDDVLITFQPNSSLVCNETKVLLENFSDIKTDNKTEDGMDIILKSQSHNYITITFKFNFMGGYWAVYNITVANTTAPKEEQEYYMRVKELYAPETFSYHCSNQTFYFPKNPKQYLNIEELQLQAFPTHSNSSPPSASNLTFGSPYDCVGFMSAPIWSGLFVTFILVLIMTCGLTMMMDIKTMDRFDDPKGKTITVTATE